MLVCFKNSSSTPSFSHSYKRTEAKGYAGKPCIDYNSCYKLKLDKDEFPRSSENKSCQKCVGNPYSSAKTCLDDARGDTVDPDVTVAEIRSESSS